MFGVGSIAGVIFVNFYSDYQGRKFSLIISMVAMCLASSFLLLGSMLDEVVLFVVAEVLGGFGADSFLAVSYVYMNKVMSKSWSDRAFVVANCAA